MQVWRTTHSLFKADGPCPSLCAISFVLLTTAYFLIHCSHRNQNIWILSVETSVPARSCQYLFSEKSVSFGQSPFLFSYTGQGNRGGWEEARVNKGTKYYTTTENLRQSNVKKERNFTVSPVYFWTDIVSEKEREKSLKIMMQAHPNTPSVCFGSYGLLESEPYDETMQSDGLHFSDQESIFHYNGFLNLELCHWIWCDTTPLFPSFLNIFSDFLLSSDHVAIMESGAMTRNY